MNLLFKFWSKEKGINEPYELKGMGPDAEWTKLGHRLPEKVFKKYGDGFYVQCWAKVEGKRYRVRIFMNLYDDKIKPADDKTPKPAIL